MQMNYGWMRWLMFVKIKKIISNMERSNQTEIDYRMLKLAERFVREEFLVLCYSRKVKKNAEGVIEYVPDPLP